MDGSNRLFEAEGGRRQSLRQSVSELKQRQIFRVAVAYTVAAWLVVQVAATVGPAFDAPPWFLRAVILIAVAGFVLTIGYFLLFREPVERRGWLGSRKVYLRVLTAGVLLALLATAATWLVRGGILFGSERVSLAVLPFADLSPSRDKAYFAEGIAEEILSTLAAEKDIKVLGRTSARQIERNPDPEAIRASLGITHLLEGSTRTAGDQLRINVRLIDTADGSQLWEEEYQGKLADVFGVQDSIAAAVVRRLRGTFFSKTIRSSTPASIDAYEAYLAARALIRENKREPMIRAWRMARQIVDAHPSYAPGHAIYAELTHLLTEGQFSYGSIPPQKSRPVILAHARKAIQLAPDRAEGYAAIGLALPWHESVAPYLKALEFDPSRADVRGRLSIALNILGRQEEAFEQIRLATQTDPLAAGSLNRYAQMLAASGQADEAMRAIEQFELRGGSKAQAWRFRGNTYRYLGDESQHIGSRLEALAIDPGLPYQHEWLVQAYHLLGLRPEAAKYRSKVSAYFQLFINDDRGALRDRVAADGSSAWGTNGINFAIFSLARSRDWNALAQFYGRRPASHSHLCVAAFRFTPFIIMALQAQRRTDEAGRLLACTEQRVEAELGMRYRAPDDAPGELEMLRASLLALRDDRRGLDWLEKAVQRGWMGQYYSASLPDWPQFDPWRGDPRYAALQRQIDAKIAKERAEVLALRLTS